MSIAAQRPALASARATSPRPADAEPARARDPGDPGEAARAARRDYGRLCRPRAAALMETLRLHQVYERGSGDTLWARGLGAPDEAVDASLTPVSDFVGGFGALILGHNHPALRQVLIGELERERPFAAQMSCRSRAARLAALLHEAVSARTGEAFSVLLASSGAEAVEAALKHAEMAHGSWLDRERARLEPLLSTIEQGLAAGRYRVDDPRLSALVARGRSPAELSAAIRARFEDRWQAIRPVTIALERAFHGKTIGALALTHHDSYRDPFARLLGATEFVPLGDVEALERAVARHLVTYAWPEVGADNTVRLVRRQRCAVTAMFVEPIQGEGGVRPCPASYLRACRAIADRERFALVFDEIQCGMGRTGTLLYSEQTGVVADYYLLSKSLGGGLAKVSALLVKASLYEPELGLVHTSTFAEDDLSSAVAARCLELVCEPGGAADRARERGAVLHEALRAVARAHPRVVADVRGVGLMLGFELAGPAAFPRGVLRALAEQDLLGYVIAGYLLHEHRVRVLPCISNPAVLRLEPSCDIGETDCQRLIRGLHRVCEALEKNNGQHLLRYLVCAERPGDEAPIASYEGEWEPPHTAGRRRVALLGYFVDTEQMLRWDPSFVELTPAQRRQLIDHLMLEVEPSLIATRLVRSPTGAEVELRYFGLFADSQAMHDALRGPARRALRDQIERAAALAAEQGCELFGLGGLTSVLTANGRDLAAPGVGITTGNSLTVATCLEAVEREAGRRALDLSACTAAAVGAAGNIGSTYCELLAERVARLVLIARPGREAHLSRLVERLVSRAYQGLLAATREQAPGGLAASLARLAVTRSLLARRVAVHRAVPDIVAALPGDPAAPLVVTSDAGALASAQIILGASNAPTPLIRAEHVGPGPVMVIDVAVPGDAAPSLARLAPRVSVLTGGAVDLGPLNRDFVSHAPLPAGQVYACMAEVAVLGLDGHRGPYSVGPIEARKVREVHAMAARHGLRLADSPVPNTDDPLTRAGGEPR